MCRNKHNFLWVMLQCRWKSVEKLNNPQKGVWCERCGLENWKIRSIESDATWRHRRINVYVTAPNKTKGNGWFIFIDICHFSKDYFSLLSSLPRLPMKNASKTSVIQSFAKINHRRDVNLSKSNPNVCGWSILFSGTRKSSLSLICFEIVFTRQLLNVIIVSDDFHLFHFHANK